MITTKELIQSIKDNEAKIIYNSHKAMNDVRDGSYATINPLNEDIQVTLSGNTCTVLNLTSNTTSFYSDPEPNVTLQPDPAWTGNNIILQPTPSSNNMNVTIL